MKSIILLTLIINQIPVVPAEEPTTANPETCRYKNYDIPIDTFKEAMGKKCFEFLFPKFNVERAKDKCMILTKSECNYWNHCIDNAEECCRLQKESEALELKRNETNSDRSSCNHTWDGFSCWKRTPAGKSVTKKCPAYVSFPDDNDGLYVTNHCRGNGTWNTHPQTNEQWTDYSPCFLGKFKEAKTIHLVSIYVNAASVLMLGPSIGIFMGFKFLRREMTIRIHTSFFASLFFASLMRVFFTSLVVYQYLIKSGSRLLMEENKIECLALYLIHRYFQCTTYFWMFCEAFHLHQLMVNSFRPPRRTYVYHAFAWSFPFFILMIYAILRGKFMESEDDTDKQYSLISDCWIKNAGNIEWVVYVPLLICIFLNVVFLCHIIRRLLGLQTQPNEPNSFRRSVKAIFLLFPLFGIQLLAITNRVPLTSVNYFWFNIVSEIVIGSKGIIVATLFCYMNGETGDILKVQGRSLAANGKIKWIPHFPPSSVRVQVIASISNVAFRRWQVLYYLRKSGMTCLPEGRRDHRRNSCPTIQSDVSRGSTINKSSVHYKVKPKESCSLLLTPSKSEQASSEKKASQASTSV